MNALETIFQYHNYSKHNYHRSAPGPGYLDWANQPDPFRRYEGAQIIPLIKTTHTDKPFFTEALQQHSVSISSMNFSSVSQLFFDSLALSAWKSYQGTKWALRVNPSSGNLHPTEGYLLSGPMEGLSDNPSVFHYSPSIHALEVRASFSTETWTKMLGALPADTVFVGLTSIHWRESWKYGLRAYRYCNHDLGHALAAISIACAGMGWRTLMMDHLSSVELETILGLTHKNESEEEIADCLVAILPTTTTETINIEEKSFHEDFTNLDWQGTPNILSKDHEGWPWIDDILVKSQKPFTKDFPNFGSKKDGIFSNLIEDDTFSLRQAIHQRRSAVAMDGMTSIKRDAFYQMLIKTVPHLCPLPFQTIHWEPQIHLGLFVHRVEDLPVGLYFLVRNKGHLEDLQSRFKQEFLWQKPERCPVELDFFLLAEGDFKGVASGVSCGQNIASDGCFSLGMISSFETPLKEYGPWFYPRLYWECGAIGQVLYLQAEVNGIRGTGIGCFFDDPVHQSFGISDLSYQSLYHFTVGGPVEDTRLTTLPPY